MTEPERCQYVFVLSRQEGEENLSDPCGDEVEDCKEGLCNLHHLTTCCPCREEATCATTKE